MRLTQTREQPAGVARRDCAAPAADAHPVDMDPFLGHIAVHFVPGRNWTWLTVFLTAVTGYLVTLDRLEAAEVQR